jgi:predicted ATP-grasp superfamily ATP-dependent carboligase
MNIIININEDKNNRKTPLPKRFYTSSKFVIVLVSNVIIAGFVFPKINESVTHYGDIMSSHRIQSQSRC